MSRFSHKHTSSSSSATKLVFLIFFVGLLAVAFVADFLWASSTSSSTAYFSVASNWALEKTGILVVPNEKSRNAGRVSPLQFNALFLCIFMICLFVCLFSWVAGKFENKTNGKIEF